MKNRNCLARAASSLYQIHLTDLWIMTCADRSLINLFPTRLLTHEPIHAARLYLHNTKHDAERKHAANMGIQTRTKNGPTSERHTRDEKPNLADLNTRTRGTSVRYDVMSSASNRTWGRATHLVASAYRQAKNLTKECWSLGRNQGPHKLNFYNMHMP